MSVVFRVMPDNVAGLLPQLKPLITQGLRDCVTHDAEDVVRMLYTPYVQLWAQCDMPTLEAIVISEFATYPKGVWLRAWIGAALPEPGMEIHEFVERLSDFARANNCRGLEAHGRHGWLRPVKGSQVEGLIMRMHF